MKHPKNPTRKTFKRRLLKLAAFLEKLPPKRFDFRRWVGHSWKGKPDLSCGTTACALGWATTIPEFRELGLRLRINPEGDGWVALRGMRLDWDDDELFSQTTAVAAERVFGLDEDETTRLFTPSSRLGADATAVDVAAHIRAFVAKWPDKPEPKELP